MLKLRTCMMIGLFAIFLIGCGNSVDDEIDAMFATLQSDESTDAFITLLERVDEEAPYDEEMTRTKEEVEKTKNNLLALDISTEIATELRDRYVSSLEDFQTMIRIIETNGPTLSDEDWNELETLSAEANEKQMDLIREKFQRMDIEIEEETE